MRARGTVWGPAGPSARVSGAVAAARCPAATGAQPSPPVHHLHTHSTVLKLLNMDIFYDDTALRALSVSERTQLLPEEVACVASIDSAQK